MKAKHALIHDTFTLERRYPSAPAKVYRHFSEPEYRKRWFGSTEDWSHPSHSLDFRAGGQELEQGAPGRPPHHLRQPHPGYRARRTHHQ
jgi:uncharacterized protein YndB with AHSA1/START domain